MTVEPITHLAEEAVAASSLCHCTWKDLVEIAVAVVGVAASIFAESMLGLVGFVLFGLLLFVKKYETTTRISELESQIKNTLELEEQHLSETADRIEEQVHQVEVERDAFKQSVEQLQRDNEKLQGIQTRLQEEEERLAEQNAELGREKEDLTEILEAEKVNTAKIRADVQAILAENLRFGTTTGLFGQNVQALSGVKQQLEKQLAAFNQEFGGNVKDLAAQIQMARETSKLLAESSRERAESLERTLKGLQEGIDQRRELDGQSAKTIAALEEERQKIEERTRELVAKERELRALEGEVEKSRAEFQATIPLEREALRRESEKLRVQSAEMREMARQLNEMVRLKGELIAGFDKQILAKQLELKALIKP